MVMERHHKVNQIQDKGIQFMSTMSMLLYNPKGSLLPMNRFGDECVSLGRSTIQKFYLACSHISCYHIKLHVPKTEHLIFHLKLDFLDYIVSDN